MTTLTPIGTRVEITLHTISGSYREVGVIAEHWRDRLVVVQTECSGRVHMKPDAVTPID